MSADLSRLCTQVGAQPVPAVHALVAESTAHVGPRVRASLARGVREVFEVDSMQAANEALERLFHGRFGARYPGIWRTWREALPRLEPLFALPRHLRALTLSGDSAVQALHRSLARSIRRHGSFSSREAAVSFITQALDRAEFDFGRAVAVQPDTRPPRSREVRDAMPFIHA
jgi:transposase-like protein